ncbi:MAG: nuclear transport factor 2 family protein [Dehalococcoidia bacterium]
MSNLEAIAQRYIASFNETDPVRRRSLIAELYATDGGYTDPNQDLKGPEQIEAFVSATQAHFPGWVFSLGGKVDAHHEQARFNWHATGPGETEPAYIGFDVLVTENDRVRQVYGFMDKVPAA